MAAKTCETITADADIQGGDAKCRLTFTAQASSPTLPSRACTVSKTWNSGLAPLLLLLPGSSLATGSAANLRFTRSACMCSVHHAVGVAAAASAACSRWQAGSVNLCRTRPIK